MELPLVNKPRKIKAKIGGVELEFDPITLGVQEEVQALNIQNPVTQAIEYLARLMTSYDGTLEQKKEYLRNLPIESVEEFTFLIDKLLGLKKST